LPRLVTDLGRRVECPSAVLKQRGSADRRGVGAKYLRSELDGTEKSLTFGGIPASLWSDHDERNFKWRSCG